MVLERGEVANSWRHERWDSLRLLTPNWQARLPGYHYDGGDPDGFMTMAEVVAFVTRFARVAAAPVRTDTTVTSVRRVETAAIASSPTRGELALPRRVVLASGACNVAQRARRCARPCRPRCDLRHRPRLPQSAATA